MRTREQTAHRAPKRPSAGDRPERSRITTNTREEEEEAPPTGDKGDGQSEGRHQLYLRLFRGGPSCRCESDKSRILPSIWTCLCNRTACQTEGFRTGCPWPNTMRPPTSPRRVPRVVRVPYPWVVLEVLDDLTAHAHRVLPVFLAVLEHIGRAVSTVPSAVGASQHTEEERITTPKEKEPGQKPGLALPVVFSACSQVPLDLGRSGSAICQFGLFLVPLPPSPSLGLERYGPCRWSNLLPSPFSGLGRFAPAAGCLFSIGMVLLLLPPLLSVAMFFPHTFREEENASPAKVSTEEHLDERVRVPTRCSVRQFTHSGAQYGASLCCHNFQ